MQQTMRSTIEARTAYWPRAALGYLVVALAALGPRLAGRGLFVTVDEVNFWMPRSARFLHALLTNDPAATAISVHPGVTTMWLGALGLLGREWLGLGGSFAQQLAQLQFPVALVNGLAVVAGYALLKRMLPTPLALLAALLWALDSFVIGHSRLLHTDALAGSFATLALLAAASEGVWLAAISGACVALALLSKTTVAVVLPVTLLVLLAAAPAEDRWRRGALWAVAGMLTALVVWPALWAAPQRVIELLELGVTAEGGQPHQLGNFFLGRGFADEDPGLLFYPVAIPLRLSPRTLIGVLLLPFALRELRQRFPGFAGPRALVFGLSGFVIALTVSLALFPKKFNRYLLPAFPALDILAAIGLAWLVLVIVRRLFGSWERARPLGMALISVIEVISLFAALMWPPYELNAFNPLFGGAATGAAVFQAGWGEGLEQAAAWLNAQPDITGVTVLAARTETLQPYLRPGAQAVASRAGEIPANAGYALVYIRDAQSGQPPAPLDQLYGRTEPAHVVTNLGVPFAWIYQLPPHGITVRSARFGETLNLLGYQAEQRGDQLELRLVHQVPGTPPTTAALFVHVVDASGQIVARADLPDLAATWQRARYYTTVVPLTLPPEAGPYRVFVGWYDAASNERLALEADNPGAGDGPGALLLTQLDH